MYPRHPEPGKLPGTTGNKSASPVTTRVCRGIEGSGYREQAGNTPGTTGNKTVVVQCFCSRCSRYFLQPGTAGGPVITGCSRCSRCSRQIQRYMGQDFRGVKPLEAASHLACSLFSMLWKLHKRAPLAQQANTLEAAPLLGCSGFACTSAQIRQIARNLGRIAGSRASRGLQRFLSCVSWVRPCAGSGAFTPCPSA